MIKVLSVFGTRPEAIKMAPVVQAMRTRGDRVVSRVCVTGQHRGMLDQVLAWFSLRADHDLDIMREGQSPTQIASLVLSGLERVIALERPDWILVQGDTSTTAAAALAARYARANVGHVEAGLRTFDRTQPFPEEINRLAVAAIADLHFAPTARAKANLRREGIPSDRVIVTGNTGIDALLQTIAGLDPRADGFPWRSVPQEAAVILVTAHRHENLGRPLREVCAAVGEIAEACGGRTYVVFPVHPRPEVRRTAQDVLGGQPNVILCEPLDYRRIVQLLLRSDLVITDSGGLQEEAPYLGKPVLVLREVTERPEPVEAGSALMVGTDRKRIVESALGLLQNHEAMTRMGRSLRYCGDGRAAERIVAAILGEPVLEWTCSPAASTPSLR